MKSLIKMYLILIKNMSQNNGNKLISKNKNKLLIHY